MAKLTLTQIESLARSAGMSDPRTMAAIAMAESGGNPSAHNPIPPDNSYGLWQINMLGSLGPARRKEFGLASNSDLFNPAVNARVAAKITKTQGLSAWSTYTNGAYKRYLGSATVPVSEGEELEREGLEHLEGKDPYFDPLSGVQDIARLGVDAGKWMSNPRNWLNVLYVLVGGVVIVTALSATVRTQIISQAKSATSTGTSHVGGYVKTGAKALGKAVIRGK